MCSLRLQIALMALLMPKWVACRSPLQGINRTISRQRSSSRISFSESKSHGFGNCRMSMHCGELRIVVWIGRSGVLVSVVCLGREGRTSGFRASTNLCLHRGHLAILHDIYCLMIWGRPGRDEWSILMLPLDRWVSGRTADPDNQNSDHESRLP